MQKRTGNRGSGNKAVGTPQVAAIVGHSPLLPSMQSEWQLQKGSHSGGRVGRAPPGHLQIHSASPDGSVQSRENLIPLPFSFLGKFQPSEPPLEERKG